MSRHASELIKTHLIEDFNAVVLQMEELLHHVDGVGGDKVEDLRARVHNNLSLAKSRLSNFQHLVTQRSQAAARVTDEYVHEHAWSALGVAVGIGTLVGVAAALSLYRR